LHDKKNDWDIQIFWNQIGSCHSYCSPGSRNVSFWGTVPRKKNRYESLTGYLPKFEFGNNDSLKIWWESLKEWIS
jgi:hypothetical protein